MSIVVTLNAGSVMLDVDPVGGQRSASKLNP
jgi:hypothetical protein